MLLRIFSLVLLIYLFIFLYLFTYLVFAIYLSKYLKQKTAKGRFLVFESSFESSCHLLLPV